MKTKIKIASLLTVLSILVILSGCVEIPEPPTPMQTETPALTPTELSLKIGETAKLPEIEVTVVSVNKTNTVGYRQSSKGYFFVLVDVEIKSVGSTGIRITSSGPSYDYSPFKMTDSLGFDHIQEIYIDEDRFDSSKDIYPNHSIRGKILFEIPEDAKGLKIELGIDNLRTSRDYKKLPTKVKSVSWSLE